MIKTQYIRVKTIKADEVPSAKNKRKDLSQQDKIARLYALAKELHVKIGGYDDSIK